MKELPKITDAEWKVMNVIWEKSPITSSEIVECLRPATNWSATTVYTLISRLANKKALAIEAGSSPNTCYPLISRDEYRKKESNSFLSKVYDGSLNLMLANMVKELRLSDEDIEGLKRILDKSRPGKE